MVLIYIIAFGGQFPLALWIDKTQQQKLYYVLSLLFSVLVLGLYAFHFTHQAIIATGIGSALLHICGGSLLYRVAGNGIKEAGMFTSPGVVGLAIGGYAAFQSFNAVPFLLIAFVVLSALAIFWFIPNAHQKNEEEHKAQLEVEPHNILMIVLLRCVRRFGTFFR